MYQLDTNNNTAIERQARRVREVQAYGSGQAAATWTTGQSGVSGTGVKAALALAAATPMVLLAWGLMAR